MRNRTFLAGILIGFVIILAMMTPAWPQSVQPSNAQVVTSDEFKAAMHLYRQRRYTEAIEVFQRITNSEPQNAAAWYFLGYAQYVTGHPSEALAAFSHAFQANPSLDPRPYFRM